jgi:hypothetical protein
MEPFSLALNSVRERRVGGIASSDPKLSVSVLAKAKFLLRVQVE